MNTTTGNSGNPRSRGVTGTPTPGKQRVRSVTWRPEWTAARSPDLRPLPPRPNPHNRRLWIAEPPAAVPDTVVLRCELGV